MKGQHTMATGTVKLHRVLRAPPERKRTVCTALR